MECLIGTECIVLVCQLSDPVCDMIPVKRNISAGIYCHPVFECLVIQHIGSISDLICNRHIPVFLQRCQFLFQFFIVTSLLWFQIAVALFQIYFGLAVRHCLTEQLIDFIFIQLIAFHFLHNLKSGRRFINIGIFRFGNFIAVKSIQFFHRFFELCLIVNRRSRHRILLRMEVCIDP